jgi:hypothetical protein
VIVDNNTLGFFDTLHPERALPLLELSEGTHRISLADVWTYQSGPDRRLQVLARGLNTAASFTIQKRTDLIGSISASDTDLSVSIMPGVTAPELEIAATSLYDIDVMLKPAQDSIDSFGRHRLRYPGSNCRETR